MKNSAFLIGIILLVNPVVVLSKTLTVCMDEDWFPYTFLKDKKPIGIHADIITKAFRSLEYTLEIMDKPWKRCLLELEKGRVEAIFPASYKHKRATFAYYPPNAAVEKKSKWRLAQIEHVLVTRKGESYEFDGDLSKIPQPIGVGMGGAIGDTLDEKGLKTSRAASSQAIIGMLALKRTNSVVMNPFLAEDFNTNGEYAGKFKIHELPLRTQSYFLIFSKKWELPEAERKRIWEAIALVRGNKELMLGILTKYIK